VTVDAAWRAGKLVSATLQSANGGTFKVRIQRAAEARTITLAAAQPFELATSR
jgi:hypothetical protein